MRKLMMALATASLLICAAPYGRTNPIPGTLHSGTLDADKQQKAKMAEVKGDLECVRGNYQWAAYEYRNALHLSPQEPMLYNKLGIAQMKMHDLGEARKSFRKALKYNPQLIPALNNLGAVALLEKKYKPAANYFKQALALDESVAATHVNLAEAWIGQHKIDRAMTEYARALELDADILSNGRSGEFAQVTTPEQRARISYLIAKAYMKRGNLDGAIEYLQQAKSAHFPDLAQVYTDPAFSALWKDPRLAKIVKR